MKSCKYVDGKLLSFRVPEYVVQQKTALSLLCGKKKKAGGREGWAEVVALVWMGKRSQKCMIPVENLI